MPERCEKKRKNNNVYIPFVYFLDSYIIRAVCVPRDERNILKFLIFPPLLEPPRTELPERCEKKKKSIHPFRLFPASLHYKSCFDPMRWEKKYMIGSFIFSITRPQITELPERCEKKNPYTSLSFLPFPRNQWMNALVRKDEWRCERKCNNFYYVFP